MKARIAADRLAAIGDAKSSMTLTWDAAHSARRKINKAAFGITALALVTIILVILVLLSRRTPILLPVRVLRHILGCSCILLDHVGNGPDKVCLH